MSLRHHRFLFSVFALLLSLLVMQPASAVYVSASSDMVLTNLRVTSTDPNAKLIWTDDWLGTATAHAHDTLSGSADASIALLGNDGSISAVASTALVNSVATYGVSTGTDILAASHSDLEITQKDVQADGFALADFDNYFAVVEETPGTGGPVEVTFLLDFVGLLTGEADLEGFFDITLAGLLLLEDLAGNLLDVDLVYENYSGTNTSFNQLYGGTLAVTATLNYYEKYWLFAQADSEIYGYTVPVAGSLQLLLLGLGLLSWRMRSGRGKTR